MKAEIIAIGNELVIGDTQDTNSAYLSSQLIELGIEVNSIKIIPDEINVIVEAINSSYIKSDIILITGGLGPTEDDLTRYAVAKALKEEQYISPILRETITQYFKTRNIEMPESNLSQSMIIPSAEIIPNEVGTAPGWWIERDKKILITMPGVPSELYEMWGNCIREKLQLKNNDLNIVIRTIKTFGRSESSIAEEIFDLFGSQNPSLGIYAKPDGVHLRIMGKDKSKAKAINLVKNFEEQIVSVLKPDIWGFDDDTLEQKLCDWMKHYGLKLSIMESCTGGLLSDTITSIEGSSKYFKGGVVSYSTESKILLGANSDVINEYGVISPQVAQEMSKAVRVFFDTDIGIGITGVLGEAPVDGNQPGVAYINISSSSHSRDWVMDFRRNRSIMKRRAVSSTIFQFLLFLNEYINDNKLDTK